MLKWLVGFILGWFLLGSSGGCIKPDMEPIERGANKMTTEVIKPAVQKMTEELSGRTAQLQGQGSLINPGYRVYGWAGMFNGFMFEFNLNATGVSANLAGAAQGDAGQAGTVLPPAIRLHRPQRTVESQPPAIRPPPADGGIATPPP
jgi:hypothetical protein